MSKLRHARSDSKGRTDKFAAKSAVRQRTKAKRTRESLNADACPVLEIARQINDAWDAEDGIQTRKFTATLNRDSLDGAEDDIRGFKYSCVDRIGWHQAQSLAGAAVQLAIAICETEIWYGNITEEQQEELKAVECRQRRLMQSALSALVAAIGPDPVVDQAVSTYVNQSGPNSAWYWREIYPEVALDERTRARGVTKR